MGAHVDTSREPDAPVSQVWEEWRNPNRLLAWERELLAGTDQPQEGYGAHRKPGPAVGARGQNVPQRPESDGYLGGWSYVGGSGSFNNDW